MVAAQIARDKVAKRQRAEVLASLATTELPQQATQLLHHSADRGQRPTKRQRLRRDLLAHRLGVDLQVSLLDRSPIVCSAHRQQLHVKYILMRSRRVHFVSYAWLHKSHCHCSVHCVVLVCIWNEALV